MRVLTYFSFCDNISVGLFLLNENEFRKIFECTHYLSSITVFVKIKSVTQYGRIINDLGMSIA